MHPPATPSNLPGAFTPSYDPVRESVKVFYPPIIGNFAMLGKPDTSEPPVMLVVPNPMASRPSHGALSTGLNYLKGKHIFQATCRLT